MITGYTKFDFDDYPQGKIEKTMMAHKENKEWFKYPVSLRGYNLKSLFKRCIYLFFFVDYEWKNQLEKLEAAKAA